ncbi:MAG: ComEA family DNA-binding protein [Thermodesulfobacteriota bacterium]
MTGAEKRDPLPAAFLVIVLVFFALFLGVNHTRSFSALFEPAPSAAGGEEGFPGLPMDLNTAGAEALASLPGIGPVTAGRIVERRDELGGYASVEELKEIRWINDSKLAGLRTLLAVKGRDGAGGSR